MEKRVSDETHVIRARVLHYSEAPIVDRHQSYNRLTWNNTPHGLPVVAYESQFTSFSRKSCAVGDAAMFKVWKSTPLAFRSNHIGSHFKLFQAPLVIHSGVRGH